jgi:hypothetical protein
MKQVSLSVADLQRQNEWRHNSLVTFIGEGCAAAAAVAAVAAAAAVGDVCRKEQAKAIDEKE